MTPREQKLVRTSLLLGFFLGVALMLVACIFWHERRDKDEAQPTTDRSLVEASVTLREAVWDAPTTTAPTTTVTTAPPTTATTQPRVTAPPRPASTQPPPRASVPAPTASAAGHSGTRLVSTAYCLRGTMANGEQVHAGAAASNHFPLGTRVTVLDTGASYIIKDRSAPGATGLDIWMSSCEAARNYGRRSVTVVVS